MVREPVLTPMAAARRLGVSRRKVYELIEEGHLKAHDRSPGKLRRTWVIYERDIEAFDADSASSAVTAETSA